MEKILIINGLKETLSGLHTCEFFEKCTDKEVGYECDCITDCLTEYTNDCQNGKGPKFEKNFYTSNNFFYIF